MSFFQRWLREFTQFMFSKGNALDFAIGGVVAVQFNQIVNSLTGDLLMPLINPFVPQGDWKDLIIPYFGGEIAVGKLMDVTLNSLIVGWALFFIVKTIKKLEQIAHKPKSESNAEG